MNSLEIANLLRVVAEIIESNPQVAEAVEQHLANKLNCQKEKEEPKNTQKKVSDTDSILNGETLLTQCRAILREKGEDNLKIYLVGLGEQVREILKHGKLDPKYSVRRRKNLNSIVEHIIQTLKAQDKSGTRFADSILNKA